MTIMATNDRIQLKREEIVGNDVVLTDINPKSNTKSIDDTNSGVSLEKTIERLWNAINNKLSRIVNSVNGRTGVVVLNANDVGLGNVDNVSLADIKNWVIERTIQEFRNKRIELFNSLNEVDNLITQWNNDEAYADKPYYSHHGYDDDKRGYIGYIYIDPGTGRLTHTFDMVIDTVGWTDNSLVYNENINDKEFAETGGLGVNIWKYEDALELYNDASGNKAASGLRIDKSNISPKVHYFDGVYGNGDPNDSNALLFFDPNTFPSTNIKTVDIYVDGILRKCEGKEFPEGIITKFAGENIMRQRLKLYDIIVCNFSDKGYVAKTDDSNIEMLNPYMNPLLILRNPAIGQVTTAPTLEHPENNYVIEFYSLKPNVYKGLQEYTSSSRISIDSKYKANSIGLSLLETDEIRSWQLDPNVGGERVHYSGSPVNISGVNAFSPYSINYPRILGSTKDRKLSTVLPTGETSDIFKNNNDRNKSSSTYILPNFSLCVIPYKTYNSDNEKNLIKNWPVSAPTITDDPNETTEERSLLGINLDKIITSDGNAINNSGLRINTDKDLFTHSWYGMSDEFHKDEPVSNPNRSGGLSVNVGEFLEIGTYNESTPAEKKNFYNQGKVNVRIDRSKSLYNTGDNKIGVRVWSTLAGLPDGFKMPAGGIVHAKGSGNSSALSINPGKGIFFSGQDSFGVPMSYTSEKTLSINIIDTLNEDDYGISDDTLPDKRSHYGGLRFIIDDGHGGSSIGIRVNEDDTYIHQKVDSDGNPVFNDDGITPVYALYHTNRSKIHGYHTGTEGLRITDKNVLGIQLYNNDRDIEISRNPLRIKSFEEWLIENFAETPVRIPSEDGTGFNVERRLPEKCVVSKTAPENITSPNDKLVYLIDNSHEREYYRFIDYGEGLVATKLIHYYDQESNLPDPNDGETIQREHLGFCLFVVKGNPLTANESGKIKVCKLTAADTGPVYATLVDWITPPTGGLNLEYSKGLRTEHSQLFDVNRLTVDLNDKTEDDDLSTLGGLRFSRDGSIAIRLNTKDDDNRTGDRGLSIDDRNVLGVRVNPDNKDLKIDDNGHLIIDPEFKPTMKTLKITDSKGMSATYNGSQDEEIILGPGLIFTEVITGGGSTGTW